MRSRLTVRELQAAAMLLGDGAAYDHLDHTFMVTDPGNGPRHAFCADTMENADHSYVRRCDMVRKRLIGASDYEEYVNRR